jgi:hypothetical protein
VVERWILARLRNRRFFSLTELNQAIGELIADLNARPNATLGHQPQSVPRARPPGTEAVAGRAP